MIQVPCNHKPLEMALEPLKLGVYVGNDSLKDAVRRNR
jgi:hypothetical protein